MTARRALAAVAVAAALVAACGDDDTDPAETGRPPTTTTTTTEPASDTSDTTEGADDPADGEDAAAGAEAAAEQFLETFFPGTTPTVGELLQGDSRSGEIEVLRPAEGGGQALPAATLLLRLDDADQWQVIGAVNEFVTIEEPETGAEVAGGEPLAVSGEGRGFEGTLVVRVVASDGTALGEAVAAGGSMADPVAYTVDVDVDVDVAAAGAGDVAYVIVNGGTGLDADPGEFAAVQVTIG